MWRGEQSLNMVKMGNGVALRSYKGIRIVLYGSPQSNNGMQRMRKIAAPSRWSSVRAAEAGR